MKNIGIDLVEIYRIKTIGMQKIVNRVLSLKEIDIYQQIRHMEKKYSFLAGRWAAKEAIFKAYQRGDLKNNYRDWSILNDIVSGFPYVENISNPRIMISITHSENYALAFVILF
ncbi:holo-ACP synthase [Candidatus Phytoplasma pini]|uniref:Holo-[acyl-carrier-protein] synthase n=1 Tax=Candidatus Phytoplasma pini TaxID=267362 RepID=A0A559KK05_9MOLU|nr:holo-ACP synthase [Candidatus Phytoplasma pini]TVY12463.1 Holo-[acyl-carrier-protein] synthase [Candidatus Phytoplasma pini]